jgi:hypothetical protein
MTISRMHGIYGVKLGETVIGAVGRTALRTGSEVRQESTSGEVFARFQALYAQKPMAEFQTRQLASALGLCALTGVALTSSAPLIVYAQKHAEGGTRTSGGNHRAFVINEGLMVPRRITVEHQGDAVIDYEVLATYDGSNEPIAPAESQALPDLSDDNERFTLGGVTLHNGSSAYTFPQVRRLEIGLGVAAETVGADSDIWDTSCRIAEIMPSLRASGIDSEWFKANVCPLTGLNIGHSGTKIFLRKRAAGGTFVANGTAEHIKFTAAGLAIIEGLEGSGTGLKECSLSMPLRFDGTNNPIVINTASAIS